MECPIIGVNDGEILQCDQTFLFITSNKEYVIADAKYKYDWPQQFKENREDIYQVAAYASHKYVRKKLGISENQKL